MPKRTTNINIYGVTDRQLKEIFKNIEKFGGLSESEKTINIVIGNRKIENIDLNVNTVIDWQLLKH